MRYHEIAGINGQLSPTRATGFLWIREPYVIAFEDEGCRITWIFDDLAARVSTDEKFRILPARDTCAFLYNVHVPRETTNVYGTSLTKPLCLLAKKKEKNEERFYWKVILYSQQIALIAIRQRIFKCENRISSLIRATDNSAMRLAFDKWQDECHPDRIVLIQPGLIYAWTRKKIILARENQPVYIEEHELQFAFAHRVAPSSITSPGTRRLNHTLTRKESRVLPHYHCRMTGRYREAR